MSNHPKIRATRRAFLLNSAGVSAGLLAPTVSLGATAPASIFKPGRGQSLDLGWRFTRGATPGAETSSFDDSGWRTIDLPHDWSIENLPPASGNATVIGPFDKSAVGASSTGFTVGGEGWYRKRFRCNAPQSARVEVMFEGVYMNCDVWINGHPLGNHYNGYTPFAYDLTPFLSHSGDNVLAVRVRNEGRNTRWYSGSGIYRSVWLDVLPEPARIARWGAGIITRRITDAGAGLEISTRLEDVADGLTLHQFITDGQGKNVWSGDAPAKADVLQTVTLAAPKLWSPESPALYTLHSELRRGKTVLDKTTTPFGIRIVTFSAATGMAVNGVATKLRGGCVHHDNGLVGSAVYPEAEARKVRLLKARGYNAIRTAHNPYSEAFLRACDEQGMMVIGETFDMWVAPKGPQDYGVVFKDKWKSDLDSIVLSQRNHPSIVMWSIGNEISDRNTPDGIHVQWDLANEAHRLDPTRPVTAAINDFPGRPVVASEKTARAGTAGVADFSSSVFLDIVGYNYALKTYEARHAKFPTRVIVGTESFPRDVFTIWNQIERSPYAIGDFVWTAVDYLGEVGLGGSTITTGAAPTGFALRGAWPGVISACGDLDLIGRQRPPSFARDVVWGISNLEIAVQKPLPEGSKETLHPWGWHDERQSWTWPGAEGKPLTVRVYTSGDRVELRLNGAVVASKDIAPTDLKHIELTVPYAPGTLEAVAFRGNAQIGRRKLETTGPAAAITLTPDANHGAAGRGHLTYVAVELVDAQGRHVGDAAKDLAVTISGPADLIAFGNASPVAGNGYQSPKTPTYDGRALLILRGKGHAGAVKVTVSGDGLAPASHSISLS